MSVAPPGGGVPGEKTEIPTLRRRGGRHFLVLTYDVLGGIIFLVMAAVVEEKF
jgi:hypothetical protein